MKKSLKITLAVLVVCVIGLFYGLQYFKMEFADGADYTEQDKRKYDFYTPELLKNMPRVSNIYSFHYSNVSGPNPALIYQASFSGTTDTSKIDTYLEKNGYKKGEICNTSGDCWTGKDPNITVSVGIEENPSAIRVEMVDKAGYD
ncbi:hypothetical protein N5923_01280 [Erwiniaceae bacterium BAC15a-03b]|uniref:Uncharacterized protein n=1 Tax=Winslowiella arboricola TaxID=2978220 RepID=A0A9J6PK19_9GAMM|nr:hypothetical protein [Winslowiella arboricola]MCU5772053.1 hypothetical protein [Winslowiella arboricola]MCU5776125.1 hypothetical protein [Winslowiella arboricola]